MIIFVGLTKELVSRGSHSHVVDSAVVVLTVQWTPSLDWVNMSMSSSVEYYDYYLTGRFGFYI